MATYLENRLINLNSQNATPKNGDFLSSVYFQFNGLLKDDSNIQAIYISIQNAQFPFSFYNINVYNNLLRISVNASPAVVLTLTRGNYNATTLITEIQAQLTAAAITDIIITISSITGLLTFTKASGNFTIFSSGSTCFKVIGFNPSLDYTSTASVLIAAYPLNLLGTLKLRIASYSLPISSLDSSVDGNLNILASIPINAGNFGLIMYENTNNIQSTLDLKVLDNFDLEILDDDGNFVNFNGAYWTITMLISIERIAKQVSTGTFASAISSLQKQQIEDEPIEEQKEEPEEPINVGEEEPIYVDAPDLEETIAADDLDLLLYGAGIR
jgi:hypothetical protein